MSVLQELATTQMKYSFRGRLSPPRCRMVVYRFDPDNHQGKPVVALKSGIYAHGMHLRRVSKPEFYLSGTFEVLKLLRTTQKYDYAAVVLKGDPSDLHVLDDRNYIKSNSVYFGIVVDYLVDDDVYKVVLGPVVCVVEATDLENDSDISPAMLATSVICVRLKIVAVTVMDGETRLTLTDFQVTHGPAEQFMETSLQPEQIDADSVSQRARDISSDRWFGNIQHPSRSNTSGGTSQHTSGSHAAEGVSRSPLSGQETFSDLDIGDFEDLAPTLPFDVRQSEACGIYEKPIVTVSNL